MDFLEAGYISSIGLREFLILCERLSEGTPVIAENCNELVASILEMTGFNAYVQVRRRHDKLDFDKLTVRDMLILRRSINKDRPFVIADRVYTNKEVEMYAQIFALAASMGCRSVAVPSLGTGAYHYPMEEAIKTAYHGCSLMTRLSRLIPKH